MVPPALRVGPIISFTQLDTYLRCPLRYRFVYVDRLEPDFVPASRAFGSGIHAAAAFFFRALGEGQRPSVEELQGRFDAFWRLEGEKPLRFGEQETAESLRDLGMRMLEVLWRDYDPDTDVLAVEEPFRVPLLDLDTGELLERDLVGSWDVLESDGRQLVIVDLKTAARKYTDVQVETSLQLSIYSYAAGFSRFSDYEDVRLRFDVLTKTKRPELCQYWTTRDRAANLRLFRLASEVLRGIETGVFHPIVGWQCKECPFRSRCWAWR
jgi:putative RecB family exonuclease